MDEFETAAWEVDKNVNSDKENVIEWLKGSNVATVTFSQPKYINKVKKFAAEHPEDVQIVSEHNDCLVAHIPVKYVRIQFPGIGREYTEEEKAKLREQLRNVRKKSQ